MANYYYNSDAEALRRSITRPKGPSIGLPNDVFVVRADDGEEFHLPTSLFTQSASIVVNTTDCRPGGDDYSILVVNRKATGSQAAAQFVGRKLGETAFKQVIKQGVQALVGALGGSAVFGSGAGTVVGGMLVSSPTGMGASHYHTTRFIRSTGGKRAILFIGGEKP